MSYRTSIQLEGEALANGESRYTECPACGREGKFSISRTENGVILYHCFRASCALHGGGGISTNGYINPMPNPNRVRTRTKFEGSVRPLETEERQELTIHCGFTDEALAVSRVRYCEEQNRFAFPILTYIGRRVGWVLRTWDGRTPKSLTYMDTDDDSISFYPNRDDSPTVIVVEDIPSAVRASKYMDSIALLGTSCTTDRALLIAAHYDHVIWALDLDAFRQALRLQSEHRILFDRCDVMRIERDLKDMTDEQLRELLA